MRKKLLNLCMMALLSVVSTAAWALSEVNGVYQIGTAADLKAFAELVNGDNPYARAVLTADIVKPVEDVSMIGRDGQDFQGTFDGQGHTITIDLYSQETQGTALFRNVGVHGLIQNLKVQGSITSDQKLAAGIAVWSSGIIRGCYVDVTVNSSFVGDATHGGIVAVSSRGTVIENCLAKFVVKGATTQNCGGLVGWSNHPMNAANNLVITDGSTLDLGNNGSNNISRNAGCIRKVDLETYNQDIYANRPNGASSNNYVTNQWGDNAATTVVAYDDLADGRICYQLNTDQSKINWVQRIGTDPFPVPAAFGTGQVYASAATDCDGKSMGDLTFSNSGSDKAAKHQFDKYGICPNCGCFNFHAFEFDDATKFDQIDRAAILKSAADIDIVEGWNRIGDGFKLNMKMANDIEYIAEPGHAIVNTTNWVDGDFNGQGHELTIEVSEVGTDAACFIPQHTGVFENVIMHGSISTTGQYAGSISARARQALVRNVFSDIEINSTLIGDNTSGGLFGIAYGTKDVENCIYAGHINGLEGTEAIAGFCGWSDGQTHFSNCAFLGTLNNDGGDSQTISRHGTNIHCDNVYSLYDYSRSSDNGSDEGFYTLYENSNGVENGELAFFLNGKQNGIERFYQKIGEDMFPMPIKKEGALVYANAPEYQCSGQPLGNTTYSNTPSGDPVIPDHKYVDGFCSVCGQMDENFLTPVDGWYEISNGAELVWWTNYAAIHLGVSAKLTDDIDMDGYCDRWANVGTEAAPFYGNFDGQFHTISNLVVNKTVSRGVGLIAVMNSLPSAGYGGISDADARNAEGVYIKNVVLDETCELTGWGYVGLVGMTASWAGHVNIKGVMMCGDVRATEGPNASGVFGCVMGSACHVTIDNCGMVGNVYGPKENGSFSGWLGSYAEVTNCFAVGSVEGIQSEDRYFARYDNATITNCYARFGTQVPTVSEEDFASGALAWRANGNQFRTSYWYQTIGEDDYPFPDPSHGTVIYGWTEKNEEGVDEEKYFSVANEAELADVASEIQTYAEGALTGVIATQSLLDELTASINALTDAKTILEFADAIDAVNSKRDAVAENAAVYQAYIAKCEEIKTILAGEGSPQGSLRDALEDYLENYEEPSAENPLGTYDYIVTKHTATAEEIEAETKRVDEWLAAAIAEDYKAGTDVSKLIPNYDFSNKKENWTDAWSTGYGQTQDDNGKTFVGVEAWNVTGDQYQTVEGMKPGYYLVGINGAFRPSNDRYSYNYAAGIYANGIFNYFPTVIEDPVYIDDAVDGVNCNLHVKSAYDLNIYEEIGKTSGADSIGFVVHGETGMAIAAKAGRYQAYTIAKVGTDGKLTIGIKNPGTNYGSDWTGWSPLQVTYCGEDGKNVSDALDKVLENMQARAGVILGEYMDQLSDKEVEDSAPNFPEALKEQLQAAINQVAKANTVEAKATLAAKFSELFEDIYEGKQAYLRLYKFASALENFELENLPLVKKDINEETGEEEGDWYETGEYIFDADKAANLFDRSWELFDAYNEGSYSTEEALNAEAKAVADFSGILPQKDQNDFYLISTASELAAFRVIVSYGDNTAKAKLTANIDMKGIGMQPINTKDNRFRGTLDGQAYAITNLYINHNAQNTGLFGAIDAATVKNLKLTGEYYSDQKFIGGITGYTYGNCVIENCDVAVKIYSTVDGDGTHGGLIGVNETAGTVVNNCLVNCPMFGESTHSCGGVVGWATNSLTVKNTLILSQNSTINTNEGCNTISRNEGNCSVSNVYYVEQLGTANGTKVTAEDLASGKIALWLNESKTEGDLAWFQTIGTDATPRLFDGAIVYFYGGQYTNNKPNPQLNAFAYNLKAKLSGNNVVVSYTLNAEAEAVEVKFYNGKTLVYTAVPDDVLTAGTHKVTVEGSKLGSDPTTLSYEVAVTGKGSLDVLKIGESYKVWGPYGLAINNNPASKGFGQILLAESYPEEPETGYISSRKPGALYAFDAAFQPVNAADGAPGFYGGLQIAGETPLAIQDVTSGTPYKFDLKDLRFTEDGRLFVARAAGLSPSSVYEINPDNLNEAWKPVFTGGELDEETGITWVGNVEQTRMALSLAFEGAGDNLKMYVLGGQRSDGQSNTTDYNCSIYNLGTATEWTGAPSANFEPLDGVYTYAPSYVGIQTDGQGGLWFIQNSNTAEKPALKHFNAEGVEDYTGTVSTNGARIAVTADGQYIAIPQGSGKIVLYENTYVLGGNGKLILTPVKTINTTESSISSLAFDYANNLYVASGGSETVSRYVIPSWNNNIAVTPGNGITYPEGDLNRDGKVDIADAVTVLNIMAAGSNNPEADLNGDGKVDIADFVTVLNIMAAQ